MSKVERDITAQLEDRTAVNGQSLLRFKDTNGWRWNALPKDLDHPERWMASVTNILSVVTHERLVQYMVNTPGKKQKAVLEKTAKIGTEIHEKVQKDLMGTQVTGLPDAWKDIQNQYGISAIAVEVPVYSWDYGYAGTIDVIGQLGSEPFIFDFKTGKTYGIKTGWQLAAYRNAYLEKTGEYDIGMAGVHLPREGAEGKLFRYEHIDFCWISFLATFHIWKALYYRRLESMGWKWLNEWVVVPSTLAEAISGQ